MSVSTNNFGSCTSIKTALEIIGDKWTALLVRELTDCPKKFTELETMLPGISPRTLSQRLEKLIHEAVITKNEYCTRPPRYTYSLTTKGGELKSVITRMSEWGEKYS